MGSSSAFTVGLLHVLRAYTGRLSDAETLAKTASHIEIDRLAVNLPGDPLGTFGVDVGDDHVGARPGEDASDALPDARRGPGDDGGLAREVQ